MSSRTLNARVLMKNDTAANFVAVKDSLILMKGEFGVEIDTRLMKIGDGISTWGQLSYIGIRPEDLEQMGVMFTSDYDSNSDGIVNAADQASKLSNARTISVSGTGDIVAESKSFDGTANISYNLVIKNTTTAGTFTKLTINEKGLVTAGTTLTMADIPNLTMSKITDAGTAATKNVGVSVGQIVEVEESGKINANLIPSIAITDIFVVDSQIAMLALEVQVGDVAVRTDINSTFILQQSPASVLANWVEILTPTCDVVSVNGKTGAVILSTSDIAEGSNLYYTAARFNSAFAAKTTTDLVEGANLYYTQDRFNTAFAAKASRDLSNGDLILLNTDTLILDGGSAS